MIKPTFFVLFNIQIKVCQEKSLFKKNCNYSTGHPEDFPASQNLYADP